MAGVASLGMYDSDALRDANDRLWSGIAAHLRAAGVGDVPDRLDRARPLDAVWDDPDLLLAQTCGYPMTMRWRGRLRYVATPWYRVSGCEGASHRSRVVVRRDAAADAIGALRGCRIALNDRESNTGMNLLRALVAPLAVHGRFFGSVVETGSHVASARLVADGDADGAAIDTVTFAHLERDEPETARRLRTLAWTDASPGLPLVTSLGTSRRVVGQLRAAVGQAVASMARHDAAVLLLGGIEIIDVRRYAVIPTLERRAIRAGYPRLG